MWHPPSVGFVFADDESEPEEVDVVTPSPSGSRTRRNNLIVKVPTYLTLEFGRWLTQDWEEFCFMDERHWPSRSRAPRRRRGRGAGSQAAATAAGSRAAASGARSQAAARGRVRRSERVRARANASANIAVEENPPAEEYPVVTIPVEDIPLPRWEPRLGPRLQPRFFTEHEVGLYVLRCLINIFGPDAHFLRDIPFPGLMEPELTSDED